MTPDQLRARIAANLAAFEVQVVDPGELRQAAVGIVLLADAENEPCFVLTRRPSTLRRHAGQWALPGGRLEPGESPVQAALREIREEIGLDLPSEASLGRLDDFVTRSGHVISPFVVWADGRTKLSVGADEVAAAFIVPLSELADPDAVQLTPLLHFVMPSLPTTVHAPTAAILYQFREVALFGREVRIDDVEQPFFAWR